MVVTCVWRKILPTLESTHIEELNDDFLEALGIEELNDDFLEAFEFDFEDFEDIDEDG